MNRLFIAIAFSFLPAFLYAQAPGAVLTTNRTVGSSFSFRVANEMDGLKIVVSWGDATWTEYEVGIRDTTITGTLTGDTIRINGVYISLLDVSSCELTNLDVTHCSHLKELICDWNYLATIDLTQTPTLEKVSCNYNINLTTLDVTQNAALKELSCANSNLTSIQTNNPALTILNCSGNKLSSLDVSASSALEELVCYTNQLTALDLSQNTALKKLQCSTNRIESLNVGQNILLRELDCSYNKLTSLDVTQNTALEVLYCTGNQMPMLNLHQNASLKAVNCSGNPLTVLDVSNNTAIEILVCEGNNLAALDISHNTLLKNLNCSNNRLTSLDVSNNPLLESLDCRNNRLTFASLPLPQSGWQLYYYAPQQMVNILNNAYRVIDEVDLSSLLTAGGNTTAYFWGVQGGPPLVYGVDYTGIDGKFVFLKPFPDKIFCEMTNSTFPGLSLYTNAAYIGPWDLVVEMHTDIPAGTLFSFDIATAVDTLVSVDWGNGALVDYPVNAAWKQLSGILAGNSVKVYGVEITKLNMSDKNLTSLDLSGADRLKELDCSNNRLTTLDVWQNSYLEKLVCSNNRLTSLTHLVSPALQWLDCRYNELTTIQIINATELDYFNCSNNRLTFHTLPVKQQGWSEYYYSPQAPLTLKGEYGMYEEIDLSEQADAGGNATTYLWKTAGGSDLISGTDYAENNGTFWFNRLVSDSIYCEMTNPAFPDLTLFTSKTWITNPAPAIIFTTTTGSGSQYNFRITTLDDATPIQIDWGDGSIADYVAGVLWTEIEGILLGTTVKIYGKDITNLDVTGKNITELDISGSPKLKNLFCSGNQLSGLTLLKNSLLEELNCSNNQVTALDVTANTSLLHLACNSNQIQELDLTQNSALRTLYCSNNQLHTLALGQKPDLQELYCDNNLLTGVNVAQAPALRYLHCDNNQIATLDVRQNAALIQLSCNTNRLTGLDVTQNPVLKGLYCEGNLLASLNVSSNSLLEYLVCSNNRLTFATLPLRQVGWQEYFYDPQTPVSLEKTYALNEPVDLSSQLTAGGNSTAFLWKTESGVTLTEGTDYTQDNGIFSFLTLFADSIYCEMTNPSFPDFTLLTTRFKVTGGSLSPEVPSKRMKVYPNPVRDWLTIELNAEILRFELFNGYGELLMAGTTEGRKHVSISTRNLPAGMIFVKVFTRQGAIISGVIKQ